MRRAEVKTASWIGCAAPTPEDRAKLEHAATHARSWLRYGQRFNRLIFDTRKDLEEVSILLQPQAG